jgi:hypothetical protein
MRAATLAHEMTVNPDMLMTIPPIVPRSPNETGTRRRYFDHTRCRRRDVDFDTDGRECWRHGANEHRCRQGGQNEPAALRGNLPIDSETIFRGIHFETASIEKPGMGPVNAYAQAEFRRAYGACSEHLAQ